MALKAFTRIFFFFFLLLIFTKKNKSVHVFSNSDTKGCIDTKPCHQKKHIKSTILHNHNLSCTILNLLPLQGGADLEAGKEHLVAVLPHDEGGHGADQRLDRVQHNLDQEVEGERPSDGLTVARLLVGEEAGDGVIRAQLALAALLHLHAGQAAGLRVVVAGKHSGEQRQDQADRAQGEVGDLQRRTGRRFIGCGYLLVCFFLLFHFLFFFYTAVDPLSGLIINPPGQNVSLKTDQLARGRATPGEKDYPAAPEEKV